MTFLYAGNPRTNKTFRDRENPEHHKYETPLQDLNIDMIDNFPIDPMHCIDLGVMKKLVLRWKEGPPANRLSAGQLNVVSNYLQALKPFIPSEFNRKPRGLSEAKMWKATEFRTFLMYTGPLVLKPVLPSSIYKHFMSLSVAVCILYNADILGRHKQYAYELLTF